MPFSTISDLYSPTQLRRALQEAQGIASELLSCAADGRFPDELLLDAYRRLSETVEDAEKVSHG
jgi:hypothetical protein